MNVLYSLQHLGTRSRRRPTPGGSGAGPGPSYLDEGSCGPDNDFTNRNMTFMTWNLMHLGWMLKQVGGIPAHGNQRSEWVPAAGSTSKTRSTDNPAARSRSDRFCHRRYERERCDD
jgi:hypothetical protein